MTESKNIFEQSCYTQLKSAVERISDEVVSDIYILSFFYWNEDDDMRYPSITIGYNTETHYQSQISEAWDKAEARWNSAFWLLNDMGKIGGKEDILLADWFAQTPYYFSDEDDKKAFSDDKLFEQLLEKGEAFDDEFMQIIVNQTKKLFSENIISQKFGKNIPVIIHNFEEYHWTEQANDKTLLTKFLAYCEGN